MPNETRDRTSDVFVRVVDAERIDPIRDAGLLKAALERPAATFTGADLYQDLASEAAALMHSLCRNHSLRDGDMVLAASASLVFLELNGERSSLDSDGLLELVVAVADGSKRDVDDIAAALRMVER
jgi:death-on-curing protein